MEYPIVVMNFERNIEYCVFTRILTRSSIHMSKIRVELCRKELLLLNCNSIVAYYLTPRCI